MPQGASEQKIGNSLKPNLAKQKGECPRANQRTNILSRALSCLRLYGHNFLVQRIRHDRNRRPYELRICDKCAWHSVQDEEHVLLDCCPHEHLVSLCTQHRQLVFPPQYEDSPTRLRTFLNRYLLCSLFFGWVPSLFFFLVGVVTRSSARAWQNEGKKNL